MTETSGNPEGVDSADCLVACPEVLSCEHGCQRKCELKASDTRHVVKSAKHEISREGMRLHYLLNQLWQGDRGIWPYGPLEGQPVTQKELCRITGMAKSHLSTWMNILREGNAGRTGFSAEIVRRVKDGLGIDPDYFYDDYEGEADHKLYRLDRRRAEGRMRVVEDAVVKNSAAIEQILAILAEKDAAIHRLNSENKLLRRRVEVAEKPRSSRAAGG